MSVATAVLPAQAFYPAEGYHQDFYQTNSARYKYYKWGCGRAQRLEEIWASRPRDAAWRMRGRAATFGAACRRQDKLNC